MVYVLDIGLCLDEWFAVANTARLIHMVISRHFAAWPVSRVNARRWLAMHLSVACRCIWLKWSVTTVFDAARQPKFETVGVAKINK